MTQLNDLKQQILDLSRQYAQIAHSTHFTADNPSRKEWVNGDVIPYAARTFDEEEVVAAVDSSLDFWLTLGSEGKSFESEFQDFLGVKRSILVNSGSSANLLALTALTSHKINSSKRLFPGDEVITVAAGFPTTVAPIIQNGCVPVFLDADPITANLDSSLLDKAYTPGKTKAVFLAHALGNPFNILEILTFCREHDLWLIEDNCDSLGSIYRMPRVKAKNLGIDEDSPGILYDPDFVQRYTGTWGDISTQSFYPPHHMTMGEGGVVTITNSRLLETIVESLRDWGRDCWCPSGQDNSCQKRYGWNLGELPYGYDHKYIYSHFGYNLKPLDIQAAIGRKQLKKLPQFIKSRNANWQYLREQLDEYSDVFDFSLPTHAIEWKNNGDFVWDSSGCTTYCSWFGFKIGVKNSAHFSRASFAQYLQTRNIGSRMFFGGNLLKQPCFVQLQKTNPTAYKTCGSLTGANQIMNNQLFLGTYPGLSKDMLDFEISIIKDFVHTT